MLFPAVIYLGSWGTFHYLLSDTRSEFDDAFNSYGNWLTDSGITANTEHLVEPKLFLTILHVFTLPQHNYHPYDRTSSANSTATHFRNTWLQTRSTVYFDCSYCGRICCYIFHHLHHIAWAVSLQQLRAECIFEDSPTNRSKRYVLALHWILSHTS